jgi:Na+-translocating ferredoxin:NAD+ oxidoreductase subunit C
MYREYRKSKQDYRNRGGSIMRTTRALRRLRGSIHPQYFKGLTADCAITSMPTPAKLFVSMAQHLGAPAKPIVAKGDAVVRGQCIAEAAGFISAPIHAPASGKVLDIDTAPTPSGAMVPRIIIETDPLNTESITMSPMENWAEQPREALLDRIALAGIAGMGGAGFPTRVKLSPPADKPIDTLIVNGAECEPYLTADHRLMVEHSHGIADGIRIICHILNVKFVHVAIEDNKPEAIEAIQDALGKIEGVDANVCILPTEYPQGAEKQQISVTTGREVPSGGLPMDVGCVVENVGTVLAVANAIKRGEPLTHRVTTVTGHIVKTPRNVLAPIGTTYADLIAFCDGLTTPAAKVIAGGPMMGMAQASLEVSTTKTSSGLVLLEEKRVHIYRAQPCIGCGRCIEACPMDLIPAAISYTVEGGNIDRAEALNILDCIECGCCAFVCPSSRPLVQHFKLAKPKILLKRRQAAAAKGKA